MHSSDEELLLLSKALMECPSVTPVDAGAQGVVRDYLVRAGFTCHRLPFHEAGTSPVENLYARYGTQMPNLCFAGHTDVVPPGDTAAWTHPPFAARVVDGVLYGRGAVDMKTAVAAFCVAAVRHVEETNGKINGSISLLITGDEEGPGINGTKKMLEWLKDRGETLDACLIGEPSNPEYLGQMMKVGRRGSLNGTLLVQGVQGHAAYPERAQNPIPILLDMLQALRAPLDDGTDHFQPSTLTLTSVDVGNPTTNVIPHQAGATFNVRFNDRFSAASLEETLRTRLDEHAHPYSLQIQVSGEAFLSSGDETARMLGPIVEAVTGHMPIPSTTGGTSDGRFIKDYCSVVEFGMMSNMAHKVDECVRVQDIFDLCRIYNRFIEEFLG